MTSAKAGEPTRAELPLCLPEITAEHTHTCFVLGPSEISGPGARRLIVARDAWNQRDYTAAYDSFQAALADGVEASWLSKIYCCTGQIHVQRSDLQSAVTDFLKCLACPERTSGDAWQSAQRLYYVYSEAGREQEAASLKTFADFANRRNGWAHTPNVEIEIRRLTRRLLLHGESARERTMAQRLLSKDADEREAALDHVRSLANKGRADGVTAIAEAIRAMAGNVRLQFPEFRKNVTFTVEEAEAADEQIVDLLRSGKFLEDMGRAKHLLVMYSELHDRDTNALGRRVERELGDNAFHQLQLVDEYFSIAARWRKVTGTEDPPVQASS